jgi:AraC-like DNA-binding protein
MKEALALPTGCDGAVWDYHDRPGQRRAPHRHDELELNLVTAGSARYLVGERRHDLRPGTLLWLFPAQDHLLLEESPDYRMWIAVFRPRLLQPIATGPRAPLCAADPPGLFCRQLDPDAADRLNALLAELQSTPDARATPPDPAHTNAGLAWAAVTAWATFDRAGSAANVWRDVHPAVERAARLLRDENHPNHPADLADLADRCGLSPSHLSRLFHTQTGLSITDFRNRQRLHRFLRLYRRGTRLNLTTAALAAGFGSYPQFHRVFRQLMGQSPADYRRQLHRPG